MQGLIVDVEAFAPLLRLPGLLASLLASLTPAATACLLQAGSGGVEGSLVRALARPPGALCARAAPQPAQQGSEASAGAFPHLHPVVLASPPWAAPARGAPSAEGWGLQWELMGAEDGLDLDCLDCSRVSWALSERAAGEGESGSRAGQGLSVGWAPGAMAAEARWPGGARQGEGATFGAQKDALLATSLATQVGMRQRNRV